MSDDQAPTSGPQYPQYPDYPGAAPQTPPGQPHESQPQYGQPQYGQAPPPPQSNPNQPPNYGQAPAYGPPTPYGQQPPQWQPPPPYNGAPAYGPYSGAPLPPKHPSAVTALVLGIISVAGVVLCIGPLIAPFAWYLGHKAVSEIDQNPGVYSGRGEANAGKVLGIVGTVLLVLVILYWALIFGLVVSGA